MENKSEKSDGSVLKSDQPEKSHRFFSRLVRVKRRGMVLTVLVALLLMVAAIATAMYALNSTSDFGQVNAVIAKNAYYMAESGYRFAAAYIKSGTDTNSLIKNDLQGKTFTLSNGGQYTLNFNPYYFKVTSIGSNYLVGQVHYGQTPDSSAIPTGTAGQIQVEDSSSGTVTTVTYTSATISTDRSQITFNGANTTALASVKLGNTVLLGGLTAATTLTQGGDLTLTGNTGFPAYNGIIQIGSGGSQYKYLQRVGNVLRNIQMASSASTWQAPTFTGTSSNVVLREFTQLKSTGVFGGNTLAATRDVTYYLPVQLGSPESLSAYGLPYKVTPPNANHWGVESGYSSVVQAQYYDPSNPSTAYTSTDIVFSGYHTYTEDGEQIRFNVVPMKWGPPSTTPTAANVIDFPGAWSAGGHYLSYDMQVKCSYNPFLQYASSGILFRWDGSSGYGLSFMRTSTATDYIPEGVSPKNTANVKDTDRLLMVLWERHMSGTQPVTKWLAYKFINGFNPSPPTTGLFPSGCSSNSWDCYLRGWQYGPANGAYLWPWTYDGFFLHDESTIMVRVVEKTVQVSGVSTKVNDIEVFFGDSNTTLNTTRSANTTDYDIQTGRQAYPRSDSLHDASGWLVKWPPLDMATWSAGTGTLTNSGNDYFTSVAAPVTWDNVNTGVTVVQYNDSTTNRHETIVRDGTHVTSDGSLYSGHFSDGNYNWTTGTRPDAYRPEVAVHTFGSTADSGTSQNKAFFKDFALQLYIHNNASYGGFAGSIQK